MGLPTVKKFLCCITLETGGLIIGWFNIIWSVLCLIGMITLLSVTVVAFNHGDFNHSNDVVGGFAGKLFGLSLNKNCLIQFYYSFDHRLHHFHSLLLDCLCCRISAGQRNKSRKLTIKFKTFSITNKFNF